MASYKNIEEYRKKQKKKRLFKKVIMLTILAVLLIIALALVNVFKGKNIFRSNDSVFPLTLKKEQATDIITVSDNLVALTKSNVIIYNSNGEKVNSYIHGFTNPIFKSSNKYILTYDRGGKSIRVDTDKRNIGKLDLEKSILTAQIASDGTVAIVTLSDRYACEVIIYDSSLTKKLYRYYSNTGISSIAFSKDAGHLLCASVVSDKGNLSAKVDSLNLKDENDIIDFIVSDILPLEISYSSDDTVKIIGKECIVIYNFNTQKSTVYYYNGILQHFDNSIENMTVLINKSFESNLFDITVIDKNGKEVAVKSIEDETVDISCTENRIGVLCKDRIYNFDTELNVLNDIKLTKGMSKVACGINSIFALGTDTITKDNID